MKTRVTGLAGFAAACAWCAPGLAPHAPPLARALGISRRLPHLSGVALTFDDGPDPRTTPIVLAALARADATATFFLVGEQVERFGELVTEIVAAGHEIGLHGYRHLPTLLRTPRALNADLDRAEAAIAEAAGRKPIFYRAPFGVFSPAALLSRAPPRLDAASLVEVGSRMGARSHGRERRPASHQIARGRRCRPPARRQSLRAFGLRRCQRRSTAGDSRDALAARARLRRRQPSGVARTPSG